MPRKTIQVLQCDRCESDGSLYAVSYEDGTKEFILCERHNAPLEKLREVNYGTWRKKPGPRKRGITKVSLDEIPRNT